MGKKLDEELVNSLFAVGKDAGYEYLQASKVASKLYDSIQEDPKISQGK